MEVKCGLSVYILGAGITSKNLYVGLIWKGITWFLKKSLDGD